jgi:histidinol-phosphate aminotransferase
LERLADQLEGALVLDEAYVDFSDDNGLSLAGRKNVLVTRSFSKSYALAGVRFGFAVADPATVRQLLKVKDSYNCDVLSLAAATAAIEDQEYLQQTRARILSTRRRMTDALAALGFTVCTSQANFVWCRHPQRDLKAMYEELKKRRILVRYMIYDGHGEGLRISVGLDSEVDRLLDELAGILRDVRE